MKKFLTAVAVYVVGSLIIDGVKTINGKVSEKVAKRKEAKKINGEVVAEVNC